MENEDRECGVRFGGSNPTGSVGIVMGACIALGVPFIVLSQGAPLGITAQLWLSLLGIVCGAGVAVVSAFFGLVMPSRVAGQFMNPERWMEFAERHERMKARWHCGRGHHHRHGEPDDLEDEPAGEPLPRRPRRR